MELTICHLYPDLLNTYGDYGNILILKYRMEKRGIKVNIVNISIDDDFLVHDYDIVFFGGGQDYEQSIVSPDLFKKQERIKEYIESNKVLLAICGGFQLLGEYYETPYGKRIDGLSILNIRTEKGTERFIGNIITKKIGSDYNLVGFENHSGRTMLGDLVFPIGSVIKGKGNNGDDKQEGAVYKNTYCSYLHGSMLSKNPEFADLLIKKALNEKYKENISLIKLDDEYEEKAKKQVFSRL